MKYMTKVHVRNFVSDMQTNVLLFFCFHFFIATHTAQGLMGWGWVAPGSPIVHRCAFLNNSAL